MYYLKTLRNESPGIGDAFGGFGPHYLQLALTALIPQLFMLAFVAVMMMTGLLSAIPLTFLGTRAGGGTLPHLAPALLLPVGLLLVCGGLAWIYISVCWMFALPLAADKGLKFWPALELSRRMVSKHWWMTFLLVAVSGVVSVLGIIACCVGVLVTGPVAFAMLSHHYQRVFGDLAPQG